MKRVPSHPPPQLPWLFILVVRCCLHSLCGCGTLQMQLRHFNGTATKHKKCVSQVHAWSPWYPIVAILNQWITDVARGPYNTHPRVALIAGDLSTGLALIILSGLATCLLLNRHHVAVRSKLHANLVPLRQLGFLSSLDPLDITMQFEQQHRWPG